MPNTRCFATMRASRVDRNQTEIIAAFRERGATVQPLHGVGRGCPDLLIGFGGSNLLVEVKDGSKSPSRRQLIPDQVVWHETWRGRVAIIESPEAVIAVLRATSEAT